jgi:hypothetical protein
LQNFIVVVVVVVSEYVDTIVRHFSVAPSRTMCRFRALVAALFDIATQVQCCRRLLQRQCNRPPHQFHQISTRCQAKLEPTEKDAGGPFFLHESIHTQIATVLVLLLLVVVLLGELSGPARSTSHSLLRRCRWRC